MFGRSDDVTCMNHVQGHVCLMSNCQVCLLELGFVYFEAFSTIFVCPNSISKCADNDSYSSLLLATDLAIELSDSDKFFHRSRNINRPDDWLGRK